MEVKQPHNVDTTLVGEVKSSPSIEDAKAYLSAHIGLDTKDIKWSKLKLNEQRSEKVDGSDVFRFSTNTGTECSLTCTFSRRRGKESFNEVLFTEFQPTDDPTAKWQKTYRIDNEGVVHLIVRKVLGKALTVGYEALTFASDRNTVDTRGIRVPLGLATMPSDEKKQLLLNSIHASLIKNDLLDKKQSEEPKGFPNEIEHENIQLLTSTV